MGAGTLASTVLWLLLGQAPGQSPQANQVMHFNLRHLKIPINDFKDTLRSELQHILLFASWDEGRNYEQVAAVLPDKYEFPFVARNDGTCWLKVAVIDRQGKQQPNDIQKGPPDLRMVIDTMKPVLRTFTAQRLGDEVAVAWEILEDNFEPAGFRVEYQARDNPSSFATTVPASPGLVGQARFRPSSPGPLNLRLTARDKGGNESIKNIEVAGGVSTAGYNPPAPALNNASPTVIPPPAPPPTIGTQVANPPPPQLPLEALKQPLPPTANMPPTGAWAPAAGNDPPERVIATSQGPKSVSPPTVAPPNNVAPVTRREMPPLQHVNQPEVVLEYELAKVGRSGVGSVDLWMTQNDGQTWEWYGVDKEIKGSTQSGTHKRTVELPGEGVYGFILVVKSRAGLGKPPPRPGDMPDIRVEVDTTPPLADLYAPAPDPQRPGTLLLKWAARDKNLTSNPITWEWAEHREGPWQTIAKDIQNNGRYYWPLPDGLPVQVYLRLKVRDPAGNESIAVTPDPQLLDLSEPEGRLLNVSIPPRRP